MYKIKQVAHMLGVTTVDIHSQLIEQREHLSLNIHKENGITFIDAEGVKIIARHLEGRTTTVETQINPEFVDQGHENFGDLSLALETDMDSEMKVYHLREAISRLKTQINRVDQDILLKDEAIEHYLQELENGLR